MLLGFDIGGTKCAVTVGYETERGLAVARKKVLPTSGGPKEMIGRLFEAADQLIADERGTYTALSGIGISCGGPLNSRTGVILSPPNLPGWDNVPIVSIMEQRYGIKPVLQNDANACAVAEWKYGAGRGYDNVVFLTFGTGMGAGLILNGKLYSGTNDLAGEVGHMRIADNGPVGFGKAGSFEGFCSGGGIARIGMQVAKDYMAQGKTLSFCPTIDDIRSITAQSIAEAAFDGDEVAIEIYKNTGCQLGKGLSLIIDMLNPEVIIIGSIYGRAQSLLEPYMREVIEREAIPAAYAACRIVPAMLGESIGDIAALALAGAATR